MKISLVIPCYNETANLQKGVLDKIGNFTKDDDRFLEVIIIDDGSTDESRQVIQDKYLRLFPKFRLIENHHQGKAFALMTGIAQAQSPYVIFSDIDLATPIEEADKLIDAAQKKSQIVIGSRNSGRRGAPFLRKMMAVGFIMIRNLFIGLHGLKDTQCGFKLFEKRPALEIIKRLKVFHHQREKLKESSVSAGFDLEFLFLAYRLGYQIKEVPVIWRHVETKNVNFLRDSLEALKDLIKIKYYDLTGQYK